MFENDPRATLQSLTAQTSKCEIGNRAPGWRRGLGLFDGSSLSRAECTAAITAKFGWYQRKEISETLSIPLVLFTHCLPPPGHRNSRLWTTVSGQKYHADLASPSYRGSGVFCAAHIFVDRSVTRVQSANLDFTSSAISLTDARVAEGAELTNSNLGMRVVRQRSVKLVKATPPQKQPSRVR
jgi:hypothetical protein